MDEAQGYRERARACLELAGSATLDNVRQRWETAAKSWTDMASRSERIRTARDDARSAKRSLVGADAAADLATG